MKQKGDASTKSDKRRKQDSGSNNISVGSSPSVSSSSSSTSSLSAPAIRRTVKDIQDESKAASTRTKYINSFKRFYKWLQEHHPLLILGPLPIEADNSSNINWNWKGINWALVEWDDVITGYLEFITFDESTQSFFKAGLITLYIYNYTICMHIFYIIFIHIYIHFH